MLIGTRMIAEQVREHREVLVSATYRFQHMVNELRPILKDRRNLINHI